MISFRQTIRTSRGRLRAELPLKSLHDPTRQTSPELQIIASLDVGGGKWNSRHSIRSNARSRAAIVDARADFDASGAAENISRFFGQPANMIRETHRRAASQFTYEPIQLGTDICGDCWEKGRVCSMATAPPVVVAARLGRDTSRTKNS